MNDLFEYDCKCPNCQFKKNLDLDEVDCNEVKCPKCGFPALVNINTEDPKTFEESIRDNLKGPLVDAKKYICESCKIIVLKEFNESQNGQCPHCAEMTKPFMENLSLDEKRNECLKCHTSYPFKSSSEVYCEACGGILYTYAPTKTIPKGNSFPMGE